MSEEERPEDERTPRRPRVVDKRISARGVTPASPSETESTTRDERPPSVEPPRPEREQAASPAEQQGEVWTPEQEAEARRMAEDIARTPSLDWVVNTAVTLANVAGTKLQMGDAEDARLAIDTLAAVLDGVGARLLDAEAPLRQTLAQLQLVYAERTSPPPPQPG